MSCDWPAPGLLICTLSCDWLVSAIGCAPAAGCWLLGATFPLLGSDTRHTTVSGGHPDPADAAHTINTPVLGLWQVEMLRTLLTMSEGINSVFCAMVLYLFWWIETFCCWDNFCQPSDLQNYMSVTSNVFKTSSSFHNAQHRQLMEINIKWKN